MINQPFAIHWFRRDLRLTGNPAFLEAYEKTQGRVLGLFCFDSQFLGRADFSANRFAFFIKSLKALKQELESHGSELLVLDALPGEVFPKLFQAIQKKNRTGESAWQILSFNRDYEPFARDRDARVSVWANQMGLKVLTARDHLLIEPTELRKPGTDSRSNQSYYKVFTPFHRTWIEKLKQHPERVSSEVVHGIKQKMHISWKAELGEAGFQELGTRLDEAVKGGTLAAFEKKNQRQVTIPIPEGGHAEAVHQVERFRSRLENYQRDRDFPAIEGTSRISHFLKNGSVTTAQVVHALRLLAPASKKSSPALKERKGSSEKPGADCYLKEIAWREFYYHILYHCPRVETEAFQEKYNQIPWENNEEWFECWKKGQTGFPIVDAGIRELNETGFMHNRVRMIVASFLVKDLLIDWRWGERYFMEKLLDGDLASNNGGWQWAASTGCDAQPYFRIFQPNTQAERFDKNSEYIRRWIPEWQTKKYPAPLVDHSVQRLKAIALFKGKNS